MWFDESDPQPRASAANVGDGPPQPASSADDPTLNMLIMFALAEAIWAEQAIHPSMNSTVREHHRRYAHMHLTIAKRLEELKEIGR